MFSNVWTARKKMHELLKTDYEVLLQDYNQLYDEVESFIKRLQEKGIISKSSPHQRTYKYIELKKEYNQLYNEVESFIKKITSKRYHIIFSSSL